MRGRKKEHRHTFLPLIRRNLFTKRVAAEAGRRGLVVYLVGGAVRDVLLGHRLLDLDFVTESDPGDLVASLAGEWEGRIRSYEAFGTYVIELQDHRHVDFATARKERYARPGALPVVEKSTVKEDLFRRDFTINALAIAINGPLQGEVIDLYGGLADLRRRILRVIHERSFRDDATRIMRLARFSSRGYGIARTTLSLARRDAGYIDTISPERIREELVAILKEKHPYAALHRLNRWGVLGRIIPELRFTRAYRGIDRVKGVAERLVYLLAKVPPGAREALAERFKFPRKLKGEMKALTAQPARSLPISGRDLLAAGYRPGPQFREILDAVAACGCTDRDEALRFVFDKFHRKL